MSTREPKESKGIDHNFTLRIVYGMEFNLKELFLNDAEELIIRLDDRKQTVAI